jgi:hypothetical protein
VSRIETQSTFDQAKADAFTDTLLTALNHGALCLMAVGRRNCRRRGRRFHKSPASTSTS